MDCSYISGKLICSSQQQPSHRPRTRAPDDGISRRGYVKFNELRHEEPSMNPARDFLVEQVSSIETSGL